MLGLPPVWYKSAPYRAKAVMDPRGVLADFGVQLPATTQFRVWDSTAEVRYLVIPMMPAEARGPGNEHELAALVTRDAMIGTGVACCTGAPTNGGSIMNGVHDMGGHTGFRPGRRRSRANPCSTPTGKSGHWPLTLAMGATGPVEHRPEPLGP